MGHCEGVARGKGFSPSSFGPFGTNFGPQNARVCAFIYLYIYRIYLRMSDPFVIANNAIESAVYLIDRREGDTFDAKDK